MYDYNWISELNKNDFYTPIEISSDNEYYENLKSKYYNIVEVIKK